jgi:hypothetical protein
MQLTPTDERDIKEYSDKMENEPEFRKFARIFHD